MKKNIGLLDRIIRFVLGVLLIGGLLFVSSAWSKLFLVLIGLFCLYQAIVGWCAFYALIGVNTCPIED